MTFSELLPYECKQSNCWLLIRRCSLKIDGLQNNEETCGKPPRLTTRDFSKSGAPVWACTGTECNDWALASHAEKLVRRMRTKDSPLLRLSRPKLLHASAQRKPKKTCSPFRFSQFPTTTKQNFPNQASKQLSSGLGHFFSVVKVTCTASLPANSTLSQGKVSTHVTTLLSESGFKIREGSLVARIDSKLQRSPVSGPNRAQLGEF